MSNGTRNQLLSNVISIVDELENEDIDIFDWLNKQLNIEVLMYNTDKELVGAEILCCCGGPDIRVYCGRFDYVEGNWGRDNIIRNFNNDRLFDFVYELYGEK